MRRPFGFCVCGSHSKGNFGLFFPERSMLGAMTFRAKGKGWLIFKESEAYACQANGIYLLLSHFQRINTNIGWMSFVIRFWTPEDVGIDSFQSLSYSCLSYRSLQWLCNYYGCGYGCVFLLWRKCFLYTSIPLFLHTHAHVLMPILSLHFKGTVCDPEESTNCISLALYWSNALIWAP